MTIRLHRGDLPDLSRYYACAVRSRSTPRRWGSISTATGCAWCSCRPATAPPTWCRFRRTRRADRAQSEAASRRRQPAQDFSFRAVRSRHAVQDLRRDAGAGLLHQDRVAADPHLYRQARAEGSGARSAGAGPFQAAAIVRLGRGRAHRGAGILRRRRRDSICTRSRTSSMPCWRARAASSWPRPVSASCRTGCGSTLRALPPTIFSRIPERRRSRQFAGGQPNLARTALRRATFAGDFCETKPLKAWSKVRIGATRRRDNRLAIVYPDERARSGFSARSRGDFERDLSGGAAAQPARALAAHRRA